MSAEWANERLYEAWGQRFRVERTVARVQSAFQDIWLFDTASHGRVLMLDGVVQITEADEFIYQEMIAHVPLLSRKRAENVLIIGAGDGGVLRRVLQHSQVKRAVMVEIDGEVIRLSRKWLPGVGGNAWIDSRSEILVEDGIAYVAAAPTEAFDVIIVDSTDPAGPGEALFTDAFYADCARVLSRDGIIVNQCGVPFMQADELGATSARRRLVFPYVSAYLAAVPTYVGGFMTLGIAAKSGNPGKTTVETLAARAKAAGILGSTGYWTPEIQAASFHLPPYIARCLESP